MGDGEALKGLLLLFVHFLFGGMRYLTRTVCGTFHAAIVKLDWNKTNVKSGDQQKGH